MRKGSGDNPSKVGPIVVENTYKGFVLGFRRLHFPWGFVGLESVRGPSCLSDHFLSIPLTGFGLNTLLIVVYPTFNCTCLVTVHALAT
jgi:hypothetical protein